MYSVFINIFVTNSLNTKKSGVDKRKVETAPSYNRAPWMIDADKCLDFTICSITKRTSRERIVAECTATFEGEYNERLKIFTDGSLKNERVGYAIITPETTIKNRMRMIEARQLYLMLNKKSLSKQFTYLKAKELL
jgi:hypothetical protein